MQTVLERRKSKLRKPTQTNRKKNHIKTSAAAHKTAVRSAVATLQRCVVLVRVHVGRIVRVHGLVGERVFGAVWLWSGRSVSGDAMRTLPAHAHCRWLRLRRWLCGDFGSRCALGHARRARSRGALAAVISAQRLLAGRTDGLTDDDDDDDGSVEDIRLPVVGVCVCVCGCSRVRLIGTRPSRGGRGVVASEQNKQFKSTQCVRVLCMPRTEKCNGQN